MARKLVVVALVAIVLAVAAAVFVEVDSPELGRAVLREASAATGVALGAERMRLRLLDGLRLERPTAEGAFPGGRYRVELDRLVLEHRLWPLLTGSLVVRRIVLDAPRVEIAEGAAAGAATPAPAERGGAVEGGATSGGAEEEKEEGAADAAGAGVDLRVDTILVRDGTLRVVGPEGETMGIDGLELELGELALDRGALSVLHGLEANGTIALAALRLPDSEVRDASGRLRLAEGRFEADELRFATDAGRFAARLEVDFNRAPFAYRLTLDGEPLDVNAVAGGGEDGGGFGPGRLRFEAEGFGVDSRNVTGQGSLVLEEGTLPSTPVLAAVEGALGRTALVGAPYRPTEARFRVEKNQVRLEPFRLETDQAALVLEGTADLDGPLALRLLVETPREGLKIKEVRDEVLDALTNEEGWVALPFAVTGTAAAPTVRLDAKELAARARRGTKRVLEEKAKEGLKGFLRRRRP